MARVLIVDDEPNVRRMLGQLLESEGHRVTLAADADAALEAAAREEPDLVLLDLVMRPVDGIETLQRLGATLPAVPVIMMSGQASLHDAVRATKLGAFHFIEKPLRPEAVLLTVAGAMEVRRARELARVLAAELGDSRGLVGSSRVMRELRDLLERVARSDGRVLLLGESGTGKELAAAAIHAGSRRASGPFVRVNSAAIPRELVESEMFGHERGAFTGAVERRRGRFELADAGTLFLDEVADLGIEAQSKLLRTLETGEVEPLGAQRPIRVDVRVIAATNRDLEAEVAHGRFRRDLLFRLNVLPIRMPSLRERLEDLPELTAHLFARLQARQGLQPPTLLADGLARLRRYAWPGNVRELLNTCERLTILHPGLRVGGVEVAAVLPAAAGGEAEETPLNARLDAFERRTIQAALDAAGGNVADAARRLRTDRANLYRRMKRLGIER
ncbi:MAG: sigma-54-dependent transcriptional regulator [Longimicrobiales bacterium]